MDEQDRYDVYGCLEDPRVFLVLAAEGNPMDTVPHHSRIMLGDVQEEATGLNAEAVSRRLGVAPGRLTDEVADQGYLIYRRPRS